MIAPTPEELRLATCSTTVKVFLQSGDLENVVSEAVNASRLKITGSVPATESSEEVAFEALCDFPEDSDEAVVNSVVNGTRLGDAMLTHAPVAASVVTPITEIQRRQLTTLSDEGFLTKYFAAIKFDLTDATAAQCLVVDHVSIDESRDSLFVSVEGGDWVVIDLPEAEERLTTVTSVELGAGEAVDVLLRNRENVETFGFGSAACN